MRISFAALAATIGLFAHSFAPIQAAEPAAMGEFEAKIAPLFARYCVGCHNASEPESDLALDSYQGLVRGGKSGQVVIASDAQKSRLLLMLNGQAQPTMPPEGNERPTPEELGTIQAWIEAGAIGPTGQALDPTILLAPEIPLLAPARKTTNAVAISPDGKLAALAGYREIRLISLESRALIRVFPGHRGAVTDVAFSSDGTKLVSTAGEPGVFGEAKLWSIDGSCLRTMIGHKDQMCALAVSPDDKTLATASYDQKVVLWNLETGEAIRTLAGHNGAVFAVAFGSRRNLLASASGDRTVKLWDITTGERLDTFPEPTKEVYSVAFSPDGNEVAAAGVDNRIRVWRLSESAREGTNQLRITRFAHEGAVIELAYSRDGKTLVSGAEDRTARIWDVPAYSERRLLEPQPDWPAALAIAPDQVTLLAARLDGSYAIYNAQSGERVPPAKPEITAIEPRGIQRGVTTKVRLTGKNLLDASGLNFARGSFASRATAGDETKPEEVWFEVTPAADAERGDYPLTVTTPGGASNSISLEIDDLPRLAEVEPNGPQTPQPIVLPVGVWGVIGDRGDIDAYAFDGRAGQSIVIEVASRTLGSSSDLTLSLVGPDQRVLASSNDFEGQDDPLLATTLASDGRHVVRVNELQRGGSSNGFYRLSIGGFAYVTGGFPLEVPAGQASEIELAGFNLGENARVPVAASAVGETAVPLSRDRYRGREVKIKVVEGSAGLETEPNDLPEQATPIAAPGAVQGRIWAQPPRKGADQDLFRFESKKGQTWVIETEAERRGSPLDTKIEVLDAQGRPVIRALLQAVRDSYVDFRPVESGSTGVRPKNWEEMDLNEFMYLQGEVCKIFRMPQGPDSEIMFYTTNGGRACYFDTSPTGHAFEESLYIVEPHPADALLAPNGLPIFPLPYANDDEGNRRLGSDSRLTFTAPADGSYLVRVSDTRAFGGDRYAYRLAIRAPKPDFAVTLADANPNVSAGSGRRLTFNATREDGFDDSISLVVENLPKGFHVTQPLYIEAGHASARATLTADADAVQPSDDELAKVAITARATIAGEQVTRGVNSVGKITLSPKPKLIVRIEPSELTIAPGTTITATLKVERNGHDDLVTFEVDNLPHGVIVDNIGLNGVLIPAGQTERTLFLSASKVTPESDRLFFAVASNVEGQASEPILLKVRAPAIVAQAGQ